MSNGNLGMKDCSGSFANKISNDYWVDPMHYSPKGNLLLAKCILNSIDHKNTYVKQMSNFRKSYLQYYQKNS